MSQNGDGGLSFEEKEKAACAQCLGLNPERVLDVEHSPDGNGGTNFVVRIAFHVHYGVEAFVGDMGPKDGARKR